MGCEDKLKNKEELKCDARLSKEPATPEFYGIKITDDLIKRLKTAKINEKQHVNSDIYWTNKLACISEEHTKNLNLTLEHADSNMENILHNLKTTEPTKNATNREILTHCLESHKNNPIICNEEVKEFIKNVDKLMFEAVRKDENNYSVSDRRLTYAERFKRSFRSN